MSQKKAFEVGTHTQFKTESICLGPWTSYSLLNDPKHMSFVLSRYKFCAKMLEGKKRILEVGCGDGFGIPIVAQNTDYVLGVDLDDRLIKGNRKRLKKIRSLEFKNFNICQKPFEQPFDGIYSIDVIEHLDPPLEKSFMRNICRSLKKDGICIIGTPNKTAEKYATERSRIQHINLKTHKALRDLMGKHFVNSFLFSMNDEVVHTGYGSMAHYLFGVGVGVK